MFFIMHMSCMRCGKSITAFVVHLVWTVLVLMIASVGRKKSPPYMWLRFANCCNVANCVCVRELVFLALNRDAEAGIALNDIRINGSTDQLSVVSKTKHVNTCLGFATLPRIPKKFTLKDENFGFVECYPVQQRVPSKSTPDLLKLYRLPVHNASPKLKRVNACKVKRDSARTSAEEEVDERCVEVINDKGWLAVTLLLVCAYILSFAEYCQS